MCSICTTAYGGTPAEVAAERDRLRAEVDQLRAQRAAVLELAATAEHGALRWADPLPVPEWVPRVRAALGESAAAVAAPRVDTSSADRCGRCQGTDMAHLGGGYYECRGCGHGWDGPSTDAPADIR